MGPGEQDTALTGNTATSNQVTLPQWLNTASSNESGSRLLLQTWDVVILGDTSKGATASTCILAKEEHLETLSGEQPLGRHCQAGELYASFDAHMHDPATNDSGSVNASALLSDCRSAGIPITGATNTSHEQTLNNEGLLSSCGHPSSDQQRLLRTPDNSSSTGPSGSLCRSQASARPATANNEEASLTAAPYTPTGSRMGPSTAAVSPETRVKLPAPRLLAAAATLAANTGAASAAAATEPHSGVSGAVSRADLCSTTTTSTARVTAASMDYDLTSTQEPTATSLGPGQAAHNHAAAGAAAAAAALSRGFHRQLLPGTGTLNPRAGGNGAAGAIPSSSAAADAACRDCGEPPHPSQALSQQEQQQQKRHKCIRHQQCQQQQQQTPEGLSSLAEVLCLEPHSLVAAAPAASSAVGATATAAASVLLAPGGSAVHSAAGLAAAAGPGDANSEGFTAAFVVCGGLARVSDGGCKGGSDILHTGSRGDASAETAWGRVAVGSGVPMLPGCASIRGRVECGGAAAAAVAAAKGGAAAVAEAAPAKPALEAAAAVASLGSDVRATGAAAATAPGSATTAAFGDSPFSAAAAATSYLLPAAVNAGDDSSCAHLHPAPPLPPPPPAPLPPPPPPPPPPRHLPQLDTAGSLNSLAGGGNGCGGSNVHGGNTANDGGDGGGIVEYGTVAGSDGSRGGSAATVIEYGEYGDEQQLLSYSPARRAAAKLCGHPDFELAVMVVILGNTVTLALYRPTEGDGSDWNRALFWAEAAFNVVFTVEMLLRCIALGGPLAYLKHPWNVFDGCMVVAGYLAFLPTGRVGDSSSSAVVSSSVAASAFSSPPPSFATSPSSTAGVRALRALRALRPLRTVTRFESLRAVVVCFLEAVPLLGSAVGLMLLFMFIFAVAGTNLYGGVYHQKCYADVDGRPEESPEDPDMLGCGDWRSCPPGYTCKITHASDAINIAGYDNTLLALLSVFQAVTLTGWSFAAYRATDATNPGAAVFYVLLVGVGAYVLVNLFLAVLKIKYGRAQTAFKARHASRARTRTTRRNTLMSLLLAAKSRMSQYSAQRSAKNSLNASIANIITSRMSRSLSSAHVSWEGTLPPLGTAPADGGGGGADGGAAGVKIGGGGNWATEDDTLPGDGGATGETAAAGDADGADARFDGGSDVISSPFTTEKLYDSLCLTAATTSASAITADVRSGALATGPLSPVSAAPLPQSAPSVQPLQLVGGTPAEVGGELRKRGSSASAAGAVAESLEIGGGGGGGGGGDVAAADSEEKEGKDRATQPHWSPSGAGSDGGDQKDRGRCYSRNTVVPLPPPQQQQLPPSTSLLHAPQPSPPLRSILITSNNSGATAAHTTAAVVSSSFPRRMSYEAAGLQTVTSTRFSYEYNHMLSSPNTDIGGGGAAAAMGNGGGGGGGGGGGRTGAVGGSPPLALRSRFSSSSGFAAGALQDPQAMLGSNLAMAALMMDPSEFDEYVADEPPLRRLHLRAMFRARLLVGSPAFGHAMLGITVANTVVLAMEYDGMSTAYAEALRDCNYLFTALFSCEMLGKLYGMGLWDYLQDGFNLFDSLVVGGSWLEILLAAMGSSTQLNALAALRGFRALRLLKALRYVGALRRISVMLLTAAASFAAIASLLGLCWVVAAVVGLHVFGGLGLQRETYPNFDTFLNSLVTTFNILTLENYPGNMYDTIRASNYASVLFYVAWILVGKYVLLTLFLAVTLEAFEAKYDTQGASSSWVSRVRSAVGSAVGSMRRSHSLHRPASANNNGNHNNGNNGNNDNTIHSGHTSSNAANLNKSCSVRWSATGMMSGGANAVTAAAATANAATAAVNGTNDATAAEGATDSTEGEEGKRHLPKAPSLLSRTAMQPQSDVHASALTEAAGGGAATAAAAAAAAAAPYGLSPPSPSSLKPKPFAVGGAVSVAHGKRGDGSSGGGAGASLAVYDSASSTMYGKQIVCVVDGAAATADVVADDSPPPPPHPTFGRRRPVAEGTESCRTSLDRNAGVGNGGGEGPTAASALRSPYLLPVASSPRAAMPKRASLPDGSTPMGVLQQAAAAAAAAVSPPPSPPPKPSRSIFQLYAPPPKPAPPPPPSPPQQQPVLSGVIAQSVHAYLAGPPETVSSPRTSRTRYQRRSNGRLSTDHGIGGADAATERPPPLPHEREGERQQLPPPLRSSATSPSPSTPAAAAAAATAAFKEGLWRTRHGESDTAAASLTAAGEHEVESELTTAQLSTTAATTDIPSLWGGCGVVDVSFAAIGGAAIGVRKELFSAFRDAPTTDVPTTSDPSLSLPPPPPLSPLSPPLSSSPSRSQLLLSSPPPLLLPPPLPPKPSSSLSTGHTPTCNLDEMEELLEGPPRQPSVIARREWAAVAAVALASRSRSHSRSITELSASGSRGGAACDSLVSSHVLSSSASGCQLSIRDNDTPQKRLPSHSSSPPPPSMYDTPMMRFYGTPPSDASVPLVYDALSPLSYGNTPWTPMYDTATITSPPPPSPPTGKDDATVVPQVSGLQPTTFPSPTPSSRHHQQSASSPSTHPPITRTSIPHDLANPTHFPDSQPPEEAPISIRVFRKRGGSCCGGDAGSGSLTTSSRVPDPLADPDQDLDPDRDLGSLDLGGVRQLGSPHAANEDGVVQQIAAAGGAEAQVQGQGQGSLHRLVRGAGAEGAEGEGVNDSSSGRVLPGPYVDPPPLSPSHSHSPPPPQRSGQSHSHQALSGVVGVGSCGGGDGDGGNGSAVVQPQAEADAAVAGSTPSRDVEAVGDTVVDTTAPVSGRSSSPLQRASSPPAPPSPPWHGAAAAAAGTNVRQPSEVQMYKTGAADGAAIAGSGGGSGGDDERRPLFSFDSCDGSVLCLDNQDSHKFLARERGGEGAELLPAGSESASSRKDKARASSSWNPGTMLAPSGDALPSAAGWEDRDGGTGKTATSTAASSPLVPKPHTAAATTASTATTAAATPAGGRRRSLGKSTPKPPSKLTSHYSLNPDILSGTFTADSSTWPPTAADEAGGGGGGGNAAGGGGEGNTGDGGSGRRGSSNGVTILADARDGEHGQEHGRDPDHHHHDHHHHLHHDTRVPLEGKALFLWGPEIRWRRRLYDMVYTRAFEYSLFAVIVVNCGMMTLEGPSVKSSSTLGRFLFWGNAACTAVFAAEMCAKVLAWTFLRYMKDITNQVDLLVVITGLLELALTSSEVHAVSALRVLRALKPLRLLTRGSAGMRLVFKSLALSLGAMAHVSLLCVLFLAVFAILGVQLFSGKLRSCNDRSVPDRESCVGLFTDPTTLALQERSWDNSWPNFDNVGNALLACFVVASLNGYSDLMRAAMAARAQEGRQPRDNANPGAFFWFVAFTVVVSFTLLNLYVGVIFSQFSRIRDMSTTGSAFLTSQQQEWVELVKQVFRLRPPDKAALPRGRLRVRARRLVASPAFERAVVALTLANAGALAATWWGQPPSADRVQAHLNTVFVVLYAAEAALKMYGSGPPAYLRDPWNRFDLLLVASGLVDEGLTWLLTSSAWNGLLGAGGGGLGFLRVLRVVRLQRLLRVSRLARQSKGIKTLFQSLVMSLPAFANVGALIGLLLFMYAYVGVQLFGRVRISATTAINDAANFSHFGFALSALLRVATGDNWTDVMYGCMVQPPDCDRSSGNCGSWLALPYFLTFFLLIAVIMLNLFTAVIIENFEKVHEQDAWRLTPQALEEFVSLWSEYDDGSGSITPQALEELLLRLEPPLGLGAHADNKEVLRFVYDLDIPLVGGRVPFHKTAFELVRRISQAEIPEGQLKSQMEALVEAFFRDLEDAQESDAQMRFSVAVSVLLIQRRWRSRMRANRLRKKREWREARQQAPGYHEVTSAAAEGGLAAAWRQQMAAAVEAVAEARRKAAAREAAAAEAQKFAETKRTADFSFGASAAAVQAAAAAAAAAASTAAAAVPAAATLRWQFNPGVTPPAVMAAITAASAAGGTRSAPQRRSSDLGLYGRLRRMVTMRWSRSGDGSTLSGSPRKRRTDVDAKADAPSSEEEETLVQPPPRNSSASSSGGGGGGAWSIVRRLMSRQSSRNGGPRSGREKARGRGRDSGDGEEGEGVGTVVRAWPSNSAAAHTEEVVDRLPGVSQRQGTAAAAAAGGAATSLSDEGHVRLSPVWRGSALPPSASAAASPPTPLRPSLDMAAVAAAAVRRLSAEPYAASVPVGDGGGGLGGGGGGGGGNRGAVRMGRRKFRAMLNFALAATELTAAAAEATADQGARVRHTSSAAASPAARRKPLRKPPPPYGCIEEEGGVGGSSVGDGDGGDGGGRLSAYGGGGDGRATRPVNSGSR